MSVHTANASPVFQLTRWLPILAAAGNRETRPPNPAPTAATAADPYTPMDRTNLGSDGRVEFAFRQSSATKFMTSSNQPTFFGPVNFRLSLLLASEWLLEHDTLITENGLHHIVLWVAGAEVLNESFPIGYTYKLPLIA